MSDILRGLEWAVKDAIERGDIHKCVANMSIGGGKTDFVNKAIANAVEAGLTVCVAAGNESVSFLLTKSLHSLSNIKIA